MSKTFSVNIPTIGMLIHNAYSCPKMSTPTQINGLFNDVIHNSDAIKIPKFYTGKFRSIYCMVLSCL